MHTRNSGGLRILRRAGTIVFLSTAASILSCATPAPNVEADAGGPGGKTESTALADPQPKASTEFAEGRPDPKDRKELVVAFSAAALELDPRKSFSANEAQIFTALYEGLFSYNPITLEPIPAAASSWTLSEDKREWTFTIRSGARYRNGDPLRAEDFRSAWLSILDPKKEAPYSSLFDIIQGAREYRMGTEKDPAKVGIVAADNRTLKVRLNEPASFFPSMLCHHSFSPVHPSMLGKDDWSAASPVSNGPFFILERQADRMVLAKNELYWDAGRVSFQRIMIRFTADGAEAASLWDSGTARWVAGDVDLDALRDKSGITVNAMFATHYYYIRSSRAPWNDARVSKALALALPWDKIREGHYLPAETLIFPIPGYPKIDGLKSQDLEEAKRLLAEAGYPKGAGLPKLVVKITPSQEAARIAGIMAETWMDELGIPVAVETVSFDGYYQALKKDDYVVGSSTWIGDFADPYTFLQMWQRDSNLNDARLNDPRYEELIEKSMAQEGEDRWKTLSEAEKVLLDRGAVLPVSYSPALNIIDVNEIDGWYPNPLDIHPFKYLVFAAFRPLPGVALAPRP